MNYIIVNVDEIYFSTKRGNWIESVLKHKKNNACKIFLMSRNNISVPNIDVVRIDPREIMYSKHPNLKNRPNFVCLESGEFVNFFNFNDNDVVTLCDWDVTMQREMTESELQLIQNLDSNTFGMNKDHYPQSYLNPYLNLNKIFDDIDNRWIVYNTGIQTAKISAWKLLFSYWKEYSPKVFEQCTHHAAGQALFNYIIQKHNMIKEMPITYHNAHWFHGTSSHINNDQLYVGSELVLFNHHKFNYLPKF